MREEPRDEAWGRHPPGPGEGPPADDQQPEVTPREGAGARVSTPLSSLPRQGSPLAEWPEHQDAEGPGMKSVHISPWREQGKA